jgi:hypothetical protein
MTPLKRPAYVKLKLTDIPEEIIIEYKLRELATPEGSVYIEITKGMYGLPQSGLLANEQLEERLNRQGYNQSKLVPGLWKHKTCDIQFTLVVNDFGVKYTHQEDAEHLKAVLEQDYTVTVDWSGTRYIGITLDWDYSRGRVHLSMPNYVKKALKLFGHKYDKNNIRHTNAHKSYTARKSNMQNQNQHHHLSTPKPKSSFNRCVESFCFLDER